MGNPTLKVLGVLIFFSITILIVFSNFNPKQVTLKPDEVARRDIQSNTTSVIIDEAKTKELKKQAAAKVQKVYQEDTYALTATRNEVNSFFSLVRDIRATEEEDDKDKLQELLDNINKEGRNIETKNNSSQLAQYLKNATPEDLQQMQVTSLSLIPGLMQKPITEETLDNVFDQASKQIDQLEFSLQAREIMKIVVINAIKPNLVFNKEATDKAIKEAMDAVKPVQKTVKVGEKSSARVSGLQLNRFPPWNNWEFKEVKLSVNSGWLRYFCITYLLVNYRIHTALL